ncbi:HNH endonuclease signature motif containing protein [Serratia marcescens]|uniref:HNH endonuclease signature motif containing protein n=1 Tax=Serratia marcescens TaxID=615 RepID=UPI003D160491
MRRAEISKLSEYYIREHLELASDAPSGLRWKSAPKFNSHMLGKEAGALANDGYYRVGVKRQKILTHRVVWFLVHGCWPVCIDHIDGNKSNNAPQNLRSVTLSENQHNRICSGVKLDSRRGTYSARITVANTRVELGSYRSEQDAAEVYKKAKQKYHPSAPARCFET